mmetsp:Transcript_35108/g.74105  ORF Transcript_35108/g.74105 Transcript_35108/m.74105 type:complete len:208 (-) Transcript_35108:2037-2660(-)
MEVGEGVGDGGGRSDLRQSRRIFGVVGLFPALDAVVEGILQPIQKNEVSIARNTPTRPSVKLDNVRMMQRGQHGRLADQILHADQELIGVGADLRSEALHGHDDPARRRLGGGGLPAVVRAEADGLAEAVAVVTSPSAAVRFLGSERFHRRGFRWSTSLGSCSGRGGRIAGTEHGVDFFVEIFFVFNDMAEHGINFLVQIIGRLLFP